MRLAKKLFWWYPKNCIFEGAMVQEVRIQQLMPLLRQAQERWR